jgi:uncharacterized membrane protein
MERTSLSQVARAHEQPGAAGSLQGLRRQLESLRLLTLDSVCFAFALAASVFGAGWFAWLSLERHRDFQSYAYDLGFFDQIIWNTSQGRWFETSFVPYNFLGQHFEPVLAVFALLYRLGAGVESLLIAQAVFVGLSAVPLYLASRAVTGRALIAVVVVVAFLINPMLHEAVFFGFHPEMLSLPFLFTGLYLLVQGRPTAAALAVAPILLLKEDMSIVVVMFAALMAMRGYRSEGLKLGLLGVAWFAIVGLVVMAEFRGGGSSDLTQRFQYLIEGSSGFGIVPDAVSRGYHHLREYTVDSVIDILKWQGFLALLSPASLLALPSTIANGLSSHDEQARLQLHYSTATLALLWVGVVLGLGWLSRVRVRWQTPLLGVAAIVLLGASVNGFVSHSELAPGAFQTQLTAAHRAALLEGLALIPPDASVEAQSTIVPHVSERREVYEYPTPGLADYVVFDKALPVTPWSIRGGYASDIERLPRIGYEKVYDKEGVQVWKRSGG